MARIELPALQGPPDVVRDAFYVAFLFNTYDRLADTLAWELPDESYYPRTGQFLLKKGYL